MQNLPITTIVNPTTETIRRNILGITRHVCLIEYYLHHLQTGTDDPERPHDIVGANNKFELDYLLQTAMQYEGTPGQHCQIIQLAVGRHRNQYHHQKFQLPNPAATPSDMELGAIDAICSMLEPDREYQGGAHTYQNIATMISAHQGHKTPSMQWALREMQQLETPNVLEITDLDHIKNFGIPASVHDIITGRVQETLRLLHEAGYTIRP